MIKLTVKREFSYPHRTIGEKNTVSGRTGERAGNFFPVNGPEISSHFFAKR